MHVGAQDDLYCPACLSRTRRRADASRAVVQISWSLTLLLLNVLTGTAATTYASSGSGSHLGINYGMVADNLPTPTQVVAILHSIGVTRTRIYNPDTTVLRAFANSGISLLVGIGNDQVAPLSASSSYAAAWVQANVAPYYPATQIEALLVGNEVYSPEGDTQLMANLLPAMKNLDQALSDAGLGASGGSNIQVNTAHSLAVLSASFPPSAGAFAASPFPYLSSLLHFLSQTNAPFLINAYPFFAYKASPSSVSLQYAVGASTLSSTSSSSSVQSTTSTAAATSSSTVTDPGTGHVYYNMLDAQVDAIYSALQAAGFADVAVVVSETGWPSAGDADEPGATLANAQAYNANLIARLASGQGTPARPSVPLQAFVFALFNEDLKPGPSSERHYGLFNPDGSPSYDFGLPYASSYTLYSSISSSSPCPSAFSPPLSFILLLVTSAIALLPSIYGSQSLILIAILSFHFF